MELLSSNVFMAVVCGGIALSLLGVWMLDRRSARRMIEKARRDWEGRKK